MADNPPPQLLQSTIPGPPGITWLSAWNAATIYVERNGVSDAGSAWYCKQQNSGIRPSTDDGTNWDLIAAGAAIIGPLPVAATDSAAATAGVAINGLYKTSAGVVMQRTT